MSRQNPTPKEMRGVLLMVAACWVAVGVLYVLHIIPVK